MKQPRFPNKLVILGVAFIILGILLLLWTAGSLPSLDALWPVPFIIIGMYLLYLVFLRGAKDRYIFPGMFFSLAGIYFLSLNTIAPAGYFAKI